MGVARVACACTLRVELYDAQDGAEARIRAEQEKRLARAAKNVKAGDEGGALVTLDAEGRKLGDEAPSRTRPSFVLLDLAPSKWAVKRNSFRKADEFTATFPLGLLPVPPAAVRAVTCVVKLRAITADEWAQGTRLAAGSGGAEDDPDFVGLALAIEDKVGHGAPPSFSLNFVDYVGLLSAKKVRPGLEFDETLPVSDAVAKFLEGTAAEGLRVVWIDGAPEPAFGRARPLLHKRKKATSKSTRPAQSKESMLDAITHACDNIGAVARVVGARIEIAYAGTMYEGRTENKAPRETLLVTAAIEDLTAKHELLGQKTRAVQVVSYDPDTQRQHTARWPPGAGAAKAETADAGKLSGPKVVAANVGVPGFTELDESIDLVPVAPVADPKFLPEVAQSLFLERQRQRVLYALSTTSPWADPSNPDDEGGRLLHLHAGDQVTFAVGPVRVGEGALRPLRAVLGALTEAEAAAELVDAGVAEQVAAKVARAVAATPKVDVFRVDDVEIDSGDDGRVKIKIGLVTYTVIVSDLQALAYGDAGGGDATEALKGATSDKSRPKADVRAMGAEARRKVRAAGLPPAEEVAHLRAVDELERDAMKGR